MTHALPVLLDCKPYDAKLTEGACIARRLACNENQEHCHSCETGANRVASNPGLAMEIAMREPRKRLRPVNGRCMRCSRKVYGFSLCITCENAWRERMVIRKVRFQLIQLGQLVPVPYERSKRARRIAARRKRFDYSAEET